jgi:hypothetical protein
MILLIKETPEDKNYLLCKITADPQICNSRPTFTPMMTYSIRFFGGLFSVKSEARFSVCIGCQLLAKTEVLFAGANIYPCICFDKHTAFTASWHFIPLPRILAAAFVFLHAFVVEV